MKNFIFFEKVLYTRPLDSAFFRFCLLRQPLLIKFLLSRLFYGFIRVFGFVPEEKYLNKRWAFLGGVKNPEKKAADFWRFRKRTVHKVLADKVNLWISRYPDFLIAPLADSFGAELFANGFNLHEGRFLSAFSFEDIYKSAARAVKPALVVDSVQKAVNTGVETLFVYNGKIFSDAASCRRYIAIFGIFNALVLLCMSAGLSLLSLYFTSSTFSRELFLSYFSIPLIPLLNTLPILFITAFFFLIFNRVWTAFLLSSGITLLMTFINYFKLSLRNDPLMAADLRLISESGTIVKRYDISPDWRMIVVVFFCALIVIAAVFTARGRLGSARIRLSASVALVCVAVFAFFTLYSNPSVYGNTENLRHISQWSATQQYISRGFIYPFLYSVQSASPKQPPGYVKAEAEDMLSDYRYDDIPEDKKVNIVAVMCEAFNDFSKFNRIEFLKDPYKPLHELQERSYSGEIITNVFAGGTSDTEWSFLTGYTSFHEFRAPVNSYVRYLSEQGYYTEGSHPCYDWFYNRANVNRYLGFNNYYFYENRYAKLADYNIASDDILFQEIRNLFEQHMENDGSPYFSFNVTYQNHGPYSGDTAYYDTKYVADKDYSSESLYIMNNYFAGIANTVYNIAYMADYFESRPEPVIFVVFGDHNPWLGYSNSVYTELGINLDFGSYKGFSNYYAVPYLFFANEAAKRMFFKDFTGKGGDFSPYFLMNELFSLLDWGGNEFMKASNELREEIPIINTAGVFLSGGELTSSLPEDSRELYNRFLKMQYFWRWKHVGS